MPFGGPDDYILYLPAGVRPRPINCEMGKGKGGERKGYLRKEVRRGEVRNKGSRNIVQKEEREMAVDEQWRSQRGGGHRVPSETLGIFCHKSLEFQVPSIGAVQEGGFCW